MRTRIALLASASLPLILAAAGAFAGEPQFRAPATDRARQAQPVLRGVARAIKAGTPETREERISNLWLFPTGDENTVFAQYVVTKGAAPSKVANSEDHFELLKLEGDRIVERRDLMYAPGDGTLRAQQSVGARDWSASIGTGHAIDSNTHATNAKSPS